MCVYALFCASHVRLGPIFEDIKKNGVEAAMKYYQDEELMLKISQKMGGLPSELSPVLQKIEDLCGNVCGGCFRKLDPFSTTSPQCFANLT